MTSNKLKELERQFEQAKSKAIAANLAVIAAEDRLKEARMEVFLREQAQLGFKPGVKVKRTMHRKWFGDIVHDAFIHSAFFDYADRPKWALCKPKKDGTPSKAKAFTTYDTLELVDESND